VSLPARSTEPQVVYAVEAVCGLVVGRLYEIVRWKRHPLVPHLDLAVVRERSGGAYPVGDEDFGYLPKRFVKADL
jgi:hypothetical protein